MGFNAQLTGWRPRAGLAGIRDRPPRRRSSTALTVPPGEDPTTSMESLSDETGIAEALLDEILRRGLHWLHHTRQPATAIINARSAAAYIDNRVIRFVPLGWGWKATIVVDVAHVEWGLGPAGGPLNPMSGAEIHALAVHLDSRGVDISDIRCRTAGLTASITLGRPAHPSLRTAVQRFMAGCPTHGSRVCGQPSRHGGRNCRWYADGQHGVVWPFPLWPPAPTAEDLAMSRIARLRPNA